MTHPFSELQSLDEAQSELSELVQSEYGLTFPELLRGVSENDSLSILRYNRLLGLMLKRPFATPGKPVSDGKTGALHSWKWIPEKVESSDAATKWQHAVLSKLFDEYNDAGEIPEAANLKQFVNYVGGEGRLVKRLLKSTAKYLCDNASARKSIDDAIEKARESGVPLVNPADPKALIGHAGMSICGIIATSVPYGVFLGPIAGGLSILILAIGLDAFCTWAREDVSKLEDEEYREQHVTTR